MAGTKFYQVVEPAVSCYLWKTGLGGHHGATPVAGWSISWKRPEKDRKMIQGVPSWLRKAMESPIFQGCTWMIWELGMYLRSLCLNSPDVGMGLSAALSIQQHAAPTSISTYPNEAPQYWRYFSHFKLYQRLVYGHSQAARPFFLCFA